MAALCQVHGQVEGNTLSHRRYSLLNTKCAKTITVSTPPATELGDYPGVMTQAQGRQTHWIVAKCDRATLPEEKRERDLLGHWRISMLSWVLFTAAIDHVDENNCKVNITIFNSHN